MTTTKTATRTAKAHEELVIGGRSYPIRRWPSGRGVATCLSCLGPIGAGDEYITTVRAHRRHAHCVRGQRRPVTTRAERDSA